MSEFELPEESHLNIWYNTWRTRVTHSLLTLPLSLMELTNELLSTESVRKLADVTGRDIKYLKCYVDDGALKMANEFSY